MIYVFRLILKYYDVELAIDNYHDPASIGNKNQRKQAKLPENISIENDSMVKALNIIT